MQWALVVIPMFMLMGNFASYGGVGKDLFDTAEKWLGRMPGGLLITTTVAASGFGFASGSSLACAATFTTIALPEMDRHGYHRGFTCAGIASAGTLDALIPPSGMMVVYCAFTEASLGKLLMAGILPGFLTAFIFILATLITVRIRPEWAPVSSGSAPLKEKLKALWAIGPLLPIAVVALGGIYLGVFTATEGGAVGALVAMIIGLIRQRGRKFLPSLTNALVSAVRTTCMIFLIIIGAFIYSRFLSTTGIMTAVSDFIMSKGFSPLTVVILIMVLILILGTFLEAVAIVALTMPIFFPIMVQLGVDPIWFGILVVMLVEIGVLTPPLGTNIYVVHASARSIGIDVPLGEIFGALLPFFFGYLVSVAIIIAFPAIATWLPSRMIGM
jgi:tripartite ATP-independent transporter DctM subunit